jgi:predicted transcriptional regulator
MAENGRRTRRANARKSEFPHGLGRFFKMVSAMEAIIAGPLCLGDRAPAPQGSAEQSVTVVCYMATRSTHVLRFSFAERTAMSTTTIRLPEALKARVAAVAKRAGTTPHNFILEAIAEKAEERERRNDFHDLAEARYAEIVASGKAVPWSEMRQYLERRLAGEKPKKPVGKKLAR